MLPGEPLLASQLRAVLGNQHLSNEGCGPEAVEAASSPPAWLGKYECTTGRCWKQ